MRVLKNFIGGILAFLGMGYLFLGLLTCGYIGLMEETFKQGLIQGIILCIFSAIWWIFVIGMFIGSLKEMD